MSDENVWLRPRKPARQVLTIERIVAEALALLDEEGIDRLTMRRLAERLGTGSTTLYWHVKTKDDVLDLALDAVFGEAELPSGGDWRARAEGLCSAWRAAMLRHPWSITLLDRPMMGPNALGRTDFLYRTLEEAGLPDVRAAAHSLSTFVIGSVTLQAHDSAADLTEHLRPYPTLAAHGLAHDWAATFARGLGYLLDGMSVIAPVGQPETARRTCGPSD
ncbi:TetR/AcrR family transcriptional regulator [Nonomuraea endophytica]|uniref:AcrR family transcriptional regulator n=1 Tax=Nonomuraea endophytica TaxID=714136 RepID=A0A7W8A1V0_9ACTN|nr:TetR/AcrR family transcriptional regulator C-terminal domain-containing protein [Nonomuraea endophytica]MBB5078037.1 AcrR family transcriptional regulator [Nonomuraea endophytica]